jgi:hypothetical protein
MDAILRTFSNRGVAFRHLSSGIHSLLVCLTVRLIGSKGGRGIYIKIIVSSRVAEDSNRVTYPL